MERRRAIGSLRLHPELTPADVERVASATVADPLWKPCVEGCCLTCVGAADGRRLRDSLKELMRSALALAGVRSVDGAVAVVSEDDRLVTFTVSANRITFREATRAVGCAHAPATRFRTDEGGGAEVVSLSSWR